MTAIVVPLVGAITAIPGNAEQIQAEIAAELGPARAGESPAQSPLTEIFPTADVLSRTPTIEDTLTESVSTETHLAETQGDDADLWLYRDRTVGLLRRYLRLSNAAWRNLTTWRES